MAKIASKTIDDSQDGKVIFDFVGGSQLICDMKELNPFIIQRLALHGLSQKVGDSYASAESVQDAIASAKATWENLMSDLWAVRVSKGGLFVEALKRATGKSFDDCLTKWNDMSPTDQTALKKHPAMKVAIAEIQAERAAELARTAGDGPDLTELFK